MDLIYTNTAKEDIGVLKDYVFDLAFGTNENDFECVIPDTEHCCEAGCFLYIEGTEYGGIIDGIEVDTTAGEVKYFGRTWHGIMNSKILEPDAGEDYLVLSGDVNTVVPALITRMGLQSYFRMPVCQTSIEISSYQMPRYIGGYDGMRKMLKTHGAKLRLYFKKGYMYCEVLPLVDYSTDEQFDANSIELKIRRNNAPVNHVICLGKGELSNRVVRHLYTDSNGSIVTTQSLKGLAEVTAVYENTNAESTDELLKGGKELLAEAWSSNDIEFDFLPDDESFDIGDIVGAKEQITGIEAKAEICKKIVTIKNKRITIKYETGDK